jgi:cytochrome oxidase assembly protein ShyY1
VTAADAVPLSDVLGAGGTEPMTEDDVGRAVTATGHYDAGRQFLVPDRSLDGERGYYVLTMLRTSPDAQTATGGKAGSAEAAGHALPVVRGWHRGKAPAIAPAPPKGEVTVVGSLQAPESSGSEGVHSAGGLPTGQLGVISASSLVNVVPYRVHDAWVTLAAADSGLRSVPPSARQGGGLDLKAFQNLGYTGEWFVFAGFVVFMWFRLFRRDAELERDIALGLVPGPDAGEPGGGMQRDGVKGSETVGGSDGAGARTG